MPDLIPQPPAPHSETGITRGSVKPTGLPPGINPAAVDPQPDNEEYVSPEEQAVYDQIVTKAGKMIHDEKPQEALLRQMNRGSEEVYQNVARAAVSIVKTIGDQAKASRANVTADAMFHAAVDFIIPEIFEVGQIAKIFPPMEPNVEQEQLEMAALEAQKIYGEGMLQEEDGADRSQEAQDHFSLKVAEEADAGQMDGVFRERTRSENPELSAAMAKIFRRPS